MLINKIVDHELAHYDLFKDLSLDLIEEKSKVIIHKMKGRDDLKQYLTDATVIVKDINQQYLSNIKKDILNIKLTGFQENILSFLTKNCTRDNDYFIDILNTELLKSIHYHDEVFKNQHNKEKYRDEFLQLLAPMTFISNGETIVITPIPYFKSKVNSQGHRRLEIQFNPILSPFHKKNTEKLEGYYNDLLTVNGDFNKMMMLFDRLSLSGKKGYVEIPYTRIRDCVFTSKESIRNKRRGLKNLYKLLYRFIKEKDKGNIKLKYKVILLKPADQNKDEFILLYKNTKPVKYKEMLEYSKW